MLPARNKGSVLPRKEHTAFKKPQILIQAPLPANLRRTEKENEVLQSHRAGIRMIQVENLFAAVTLAEYWVVLYMLRLDEKEIKR